MRRPQRPSGPVAALRTRHPLPQPRAQAQQMQDDSTILKRLTFCSEQTTIAVLQVRVTPSPPLISSFGTHAPSDETNNDGTHSDPAGSSSGVFSGLRGRAGGVGGPKGSEFANFSLSFAILWSVCQWQPDIVGTSTGVCVPGGGGLRADPRHGTGQRPAAHRQLPSVTRRPADGGWCRTHRPEARTSVFCTNGRHVPLEHH